MTDTEAIVTLNQLPKVGSVTVKYLLSYFGSAQAILQAPLEEIQNVPRCAGVVGERIFHWKDLTDTAREMETCERHNLSIITQQDSLYPRALKDLKDPPLLLYVWGTLEEQDQDGIAVIGSRKTTHYGRTFTESFSKHLASAGRTIISGLALGIDTIAHQSALSVNGRTLAVLGSGLASIYPRQNQELAQQIAENGAVVSEFPLFTHPDKQTFPQRNRIVAAWARATLVTEMPNRSGARITTNLARDLGRPVFSIPGQIDQPYSEGCNEIIKEGAHLVTTPGDILTTLQPHQETSQLSLDLEAINGKSPSLSHLSEEESLVLKHLSTTEKTVEELHLETSLPIAELSSSLFSLEMQDLARQHAGMTYTTH